jgi:acyl-CoA thioester hydrolase
MENPFTIPMMVRFRDIDTMGHVNNAVYATYLEQARAEYYRQVIGTPLDEVPTVLAHLELDYRQPINLADDVIVAMRVTDLGESSLVMDYELRADSTVAATAETIQVVIDFETERSVPIPDEWRERIDQHRKAR